MILVPKEKKYPFLNQKIWLKILQNISIIFRQFLVLKKFKMQKKSNLCPQSSDQYYFFAIDLQYQLQQK